MIEILSEREPIANKYHDCNACEFILSEWINGFGFTRSELRTLLKARNNKWRIVPGQKYIKQNIKSDDELYTFKAIHDVHDICLKYDLYEY